MSTCTRSTCVLIVALVLSTGTGAIAQGTGTDERTIGKIEDLTKPNIEDIRRIKDTLQKSQGQIDDMANRNIASAMRKFNRGLKNATRELTRAVGEFEQSYSVEAQKELLGKMSEIYSDLLRQLDEIPVDFLDRARDVYGNAISKGERISKENLDKTEKDYKFKEKLLDQKVSRLRKLHASGGRSDVEVTEARRLIKDVTRLEAMIRRGKKSTLFWNRILNNFQTIEERKRVQLDGLETSVMAFNQLRGDLQGQRDAIEHMIILGELDELTTEEFESSMDETMAVGDSLFDATDAAFENVFGNLLEDDRSDESPEGTGGDDGEAEGGVDSQIEDLGDQIEAILSRY